MAAAAADELVVSPHADWLFSVEEYETHVSPLSAGGSASGARPLRPLRPLHTANRPSGQPRKTPKSLFAKASPSPLALDAAAIRVPRPFAASAPVSRPPDVRAPASPAAEPPPRVVSTLRVEDLELLHAHLRRLHSAASLCEHSERRREREARAPLAAASDAPPAAPADAAMATAVAAHSSCPSRFLLLGAALGVALYTVSLVSIARRRA
jgi:hypothetical protein